MWLCIYVQSIKVTLCWMHLFPDFGTDLLLFSFLIYRTFNWSLALHIYVCMIPSYGVYNKSSQLFKSPKSLKISYFMQNKKKEIHDNYEGIIFPVYQRAKSARKNKQTCWVNSCKPILSYSSKHYSQALKS